MNDQKNVMSSQIIPPPLTLINSPDKGADYEFGDPKRCLEDSCKPKCAKNLHAYQVCAKRVQGDETGSKHCTGQYFDYCHCLDQCVAPKLFDKLK